jgi:hypothetical protein
MKWPAPPLRVIRLEDITYRVRLPREEWPHPATVRTPRQRMPRTIVRRQTLPRTMRTTRDRGRSSRLHRIVPLQPRSRRLRRISRRRKADRTAAIRLTGGARQCRCPGHLRDILITLCRLTPRRRPTEATVDPAATVEAAAALTQVRTTARDAPTAPRQPTRLAAATAPTQCIRDAARDPRPRTPRAILEAATTPRAAALTPQAVADRTAAVAEDIPAEAMDASN